MALLLKKGLQKKASLTDLNGFIAKGWEDELRIHFQMEEDFVVPALHGLVFDTTLTEQLKTDHRQLTEWAILASNNEASYEQVQMFAELLEKHIRFEERVYFPAAEAVLSNVQLQEIGAQLQEDPSNNCINYPVKFWE